MSNGIRKAELQQAYGTRPIVEEIDSLRICLGNDNVIVQTPKVEINLRSAKIPPKEMKLTCLLHKLSDIKIDFSYPIGFPKRSLAVTVCSYDKNMESAVQEFATDFSNQHNEQDIYPSSIDIIQKVLEKFTAKSDFSQVSDNDGVDDRNVEEESFVEPKTTAENIIETSDYANDTTIYTCRICRSHLFDDKQLHEHTKSTLSSQPGKISSIYLSDPPGNLVSAAALNENSGKILCNGCGHKLGHWSWTGNKCSCCDEWVAPLFQFAASKVDAKQSQPYINHLDSNNNVCQIVLFPYRRV
jgi:dual specificity phosphatase 12